MTPMLYTLIAYKSNSSDYCRGCLMASYGSDFELWTGTEVEALADRWASLLDRNRNRERGEDGFEITLLINGVPAPYSYVEEFDKNQEARDALWAQQEELSQVFDDAKALAELKLRLIDEAREAAALAAKRQAEMAAEEAARKAAAAKERADRAEYERLAAKFGRTS